MKHTDALDLLARETARAGRRIALERGLRAGLWVLLAAGAWAVLALVGAHEQLPLLAQSLTALAVLLILVLLALRARRAWRAPTTAEARSRLAADSRMDAATFDALEDKPTRYDAFSVALWRRDQERALQQAETARAGPPRPRLDEIDRYKLRYVLLIGLIAGFIVAGGLAGDRLARAFLPDPGPLLGDQEMAIEAWLTPAEYTHAPPISLSDRLGETITTPPSVSATVRLTGPTGAPRLIYTGEGGRREARFARAADGAWEAQLDLPGEGRLRIVRFHTRASWRIAPAPDARPIAAFAAPFAQGPDEQVTVSWRVRDDFGVRGLALRVRPIDPPAGLLRADPVDTPLDSPAGDPAEAEGESTVDLAAHPYAGMEVEARLVAIDGSGQEGVSEPMRFTMPEKVFLQPLARAAIEIRRHILTDRRAYRPAPRERARTMPAGDILFGNQRIGVRDYDRNPALRRAPEGVRQAARLIDALTMAPEDGYFRDMAVFLGLRLARSELDIAQSAQDTETAAETLWRVALRAEYGGAADARRALEEAQRQLAEALATGAPAERLAQLFEALRRATERYMQALVQEAMRNGDQSNPEDTEEQTAMSERDIEALLNEVQRLTEQGRHAEAQQLLAMLSQILANMDVQLTEGEQGQGEGEEGDQQLQQSMDNLSETMGEQRELNEQTQQQSSGGGGGEQQGGQGGDQLAERQSQIRQGLAQAQRMADDAGAAPSPSLQDANRAMRAAEEALRRGDLEGARQAQDAAMDSLREGADTLAAEMRERGRQRGEREGETGQAGRDPLGRMLPGQGGGEGGEGVPDQSDPVRAREIFDEIRRRAQDPSRPEAEREYLRRLLDRFGDS